MTTELEVLGGQLTEKRTKLHEFYEEKQSGVNFSADDVETFRVLRAEVDDLSANYDKAVKIDREAQENKAALDQYREVKNPYGHAQPGAGPSETLPGPVNPFANYKTLGELVTQSAQYKAYRAGQFGTKANFSIDLPDVDMTLVHKMRGIDDIERKVLLTSNAFVPKNIRSDVVHPYGFQKPKLVDIIPTYTTENKVVKYMLESAPTNNAAAAAESSAASESVLAWVETSTTVEKVTSFVTVSQEQLDDVAGMEQLINMRLADLHAAKEDFYLIQGTGTTPQIKGLNATAHTAVSTQALGVDAAPDAIYKAMVKVMTNAATLSMAEPTALVIAPANWQPIQLLTTADGIYIWGSPANQMGTPTMWGMPVILTTNCESNTAIVADFQRHMRIARRQGVTVEMSDSHDVNFTKNVLTIKTTSRLALELFRQQAVCLVTGLT